MQDKETIELFRLSVDASMRKRKLAVLLVTEVEQVKLSWWGRAGRMLCG